MDFLALFLAGLIDSVNPCALTVGVYFLAYIFFVNYSAKRVQFFGSSFILSIFLTSLLMEWGVFGAFRHLEISFIIANTTHVFLGVLAVVLGILNFYDWAVYRKTGDCEKSIFLKMGAAKNKTAAISAAPAQGNYRGEIHGPVKTILIAIFGGFVFGILESAGRGYPYFPAAVIMLIKQNLVFKALAGVVLYSIALTLPLLAILVLLVKGLKGRSPADFVKAYFPKVKIVSAAVFLGLGLGLLFMFLLKGDR